MNRLRVLLRDQRGFTMIEMITVLSVIAVLSALIFFNSTTGNRRQGLRDAAGNFVSLTRKIESQASGAEAIGGTSRKAYGICITSTTARDANGTFPKSHCASAGTNPNAYQLYARKLSDTTSNPTLNLSPNNPDIIQSVSLPKDYVFSESSLYLDFVPPRPALFANGTSADRALRIIYTGSNGCASVADCKTIRIRPNAEVIYVE